SPALTKEIMDWAVKIAGGLLLCYVADSRRTPPRILSTPWLRWCGIVSYEWYLFHQPILYWIRILFGAANGSLPKFILTQGSSFIVTLALGACVYRFFSLPILKYGRAKNTSNVGKTESGDRLAASQSADATR